VGGERGEPLDKERSSNLLKSLPLYSQVCTAARRVCIAAPMPNTPAPEPSAPHPGPIGMPIVVLDTNVVLDWLVFKDASCLTLASQVQARELMWHATASMRAELLSVLPRPQLQGWGPDLDHILCVFDEFAHVLDVGPPTAVTDAPRCRDPDDQKFIDLALTLGAHWLFSRDRALLELAKPARARGLEILTPADWMRRYATPEASFAGGVME
jgi:putative PIN family toxin of toxin-antitoxin system